MTVQGFVVSGSVACVVSLLLSTPTLQAAPEAICVPWQPASPSVAHCTYSGAQTRVKGIARGGATEYYWEFGDGDSTSWTAISDPYNLGATHTYTGLVGQEFIATLHVKDGLGEEHQDTYPIEIHESSDLSDPDHLKVRINMAVDESLWWLHTDMIRGTYGGGSPGYGQPYGWWNVSGGADYDVPAVGTAVDAFQLHGSKANGDYDGDPYVETVQRGMNYILCHAYDKGIDEEPAGNPDTNGNGIGLFINYRDVWSCTRSTYIGGICAITVASSGAPNRIASVGGAYVYGRPYREIVQDLVDYFAWGQVDIAYGVYRGGWRYHANYTSSDMSTTQWPVLAILAAEENMGVDVLGPVDGVTVPPFVRSELPYFLNHTRHDSCDAYYGGYGYTTASDYINCLKAAVGIICWEWHGTPLTDPNVTGALGYLYRHWNDNGASWQDQPIHGNSYGMYAVMKAMRIPEPDMEVIVDHNDPPCNCDDQPTGNTLDWYYATGCGSPQGAAQAYYQEGLAHYAVRNQHADGSWDDTTGPNRVYDAFATGWQVLTLLKGVVIRPPVAVICDCDEQEYNLNQDIHLDGSCSYHPDPNRTIPSDGYEWDFEYDGAFVADATGMTTTIVGGYPATGIYPVALRVTDDNPTPQTDIAVCDIDVHEPPHCPHAFADGPYIGWVNVAVMFDASASWDPDNEIVSYDWDLDNDGLFGAEDNDCFGQPSDAVGLNPQWTWSDPYFGVLGLRVTDAAGEFPACSDYDYTTVEIGNHAPIADPNGPYTACAGCTIILDGGGSHDPDPGDAIALYAWDLDNDGEFDDSGDVQPAFTVGPDVGVIYDICLKVTDSFGEYDIECTTVEVVPNFPPVCDANGPYTAECAGVSTSIPLDGTGSSDPDGDLLTYAWTSDCPGASFDSSISGTPILTLDSGGSCSTSCNVYLTVDDGNGGTADCSATVTVTDTTPPEITCPPDVTITCGDPTDPDATGWATATDICDDNPAYPTIAYADVETPTTCLADPVMYTITRTWTATDECDNSSECVQTITVLRVVHSGMIIKQGACPAPLNRNSHGVLPVLLPGDDDFDVSEVDLSTVRLSRADCVGGQVAPNEGPPGPHSQFKDLNHPYTGEGPCSCNDDQAVDEIMDLSMKFRTDDLVEALELNDLLPGAIVELVLSGALLDGCEFIAADCVRLVPPGTPPGEVIVQSNAPDVWIDVGPLDNQLDGGGFADFVRAYPLSTVATCIVQAPYEGKRFVGWKINGEFLYTEPSLTLTVEDDSLTLDAILRLPGEIDDRPGIDLNDFATFVLCFRGPGIATPPAGCSLEDYASADLDSDSDVDLNDFATFAVNFGG